MTPPPSGLANAAGSQGQEMIAASTVSQISPTRCQVRTRLYRDGRLELEGFPVADISEYLTDESVTIWLDLRDPDQDDLAVLSEEFGLHPLAVKAALRHSQRPKLDRYPSHLFLTAYAARLDPGTGELAASELAAFITSRALITVRQDDGLDIGAVVQRWDENPDLAKFGVGYLLYELLDGALPHFQAQGLAVRPKIREAGQPASLGQDDSQQNGRAQQFRAVAVRYDKRALTYQRAVHVASIRI